LSIERNVAAGIGYDRERSAVGALQLVEILPYHDQLKQPRECGENTSDKDQRKPRRPLREGLRPERRVSFAAPSPTQSGSYRATVRLIHVGIESSAGAEVDFARHFFNTMQARTFAPSTSRLRWVYANYLFPKQPRERTRRGRLPRRWCRTRSVTIVSRWPLPGQMLVSPETESESGVDCHPKRDVAANSHCE
jgi:hypothetical protein